MLSSAKNAITGSNNVNPKKDNTSNNSAKNTNESDETTILKEISKQNVSYSLSNFKSTQNQNKLKIANNEIEISYQNNVHGIRQDFIIQKKINLNSPLKVKIEISSPFKILGANDKIVHLKNVLL
jgi:hypothetical protein